MSSRSSDPVSRSLAPRVLLALGAVIATLLSVLAFSPAAQAATSQFTPGQPWNDSSGRTLQLHGLGIIKSGSTWYGFGEDKTGENSSNTSFQDIPCYSSTDLSHWTVRGKALVRQSSGDLGPNRIVERPKVIYNAGTKTYVMYMHIDNSSYGEAKVGMATSSTPCGPYTYHHSFQPLGFQSRDLGLYQDTDGTGYLLSEDRAHGLRIDKLSSDYLSVTSAVAAFGDYEAPAMVKVGGRYFILGSHLTGWSTNDNVYASATSLSGPWSSFRTFAPVGTRTYNTQTANIITVQGSAGTTYIYAGDRWTTSNLQTSPLVWLPMNIKGSTVTVGWQNTWNLDTAAGTWSGSSNPANSTRRLLNQNSSSPMEVLNGATANGTAIVQGTKTGSTSQQWKLTQVSAGLYTVTGVRSGRCLEVPNNSTVQGTQLDIRDCNGGADQLWALNATGSYTSSGDTSYVLVNMNSGLLADVSGAATTSGTAVIQWGGNGRANQTWNLT